MAANEIMILFLCDHQALGLLFRKGVDYRIEQIGRGDGNENPPHATSYVKLINACMSSDASEKRDVAKQK